MVTMINIGCVGCAFGCPGCLPKNAIWDLPPIYMSEEPLLKERVQLIYDPEIGAYRIPLIVDRSKFTILSAYCEIVTNE
jgi:hypothetical protein